MFYKIVYLCYNKPNPSKKKAQILSITVTEMLAEVFHWCTQCPQWCVWQLTKAESHAPLLFCQHIS